MNVTPRKIAVLGATGSVGTTTLSLVEAINRKASGTPEQGPIALEVLTANSDWEGLGELALKFRPERVVVASEDAREALSLKLKDSGIEVAAGQTALREAGGGEADWVMAAIVGAAGLAPTLEAAKRGATLALANKECLVSAGPIFMDVVSKAQAQLLPVDSEHNAIFQVFDFDRPEAVKSITLTASGGPFRTWTKDQIAAAKPAEAVAHPNWDMGAKISVDSATLMNKGLELIEAFYLFPVELEQIEVVVHPQSAIHSFVTYRDGSMLAQMGSPDMAIPISYALAFPDRLDVPAEPLDLAKLGSMTFEAPDLERFPALGLARDAIGLGGIAPTVLNAANEIAVAEFLAGNIQFSAISQVVEEVLNGFGHIGHTLSEALGSLEQVFEIDALARDEARQRIMKVAAE